MADVTFPPGFPTLSGDLLTVNRFLAQPTLIQRMLRTMAEQRFIADAIFAGRATPNGGAIMYEQNESIFPDEAVEAVEPGGEFPLSTTSRGPAKIADVRKWGIDTEVTMESIMRLLMNPVDRAMFKLSNGVIRQVDSNALNILFADPRIQTLVGTSWAAAGDAATIVTQILQGVSNIVGLNQGYEPDTLVINDDTKVNLLASERISNMMAREQLSNPIYTGQMDRKLLGLDVMVTNNVAGLADGLGQGGMKAIVLDRKVMGGMADEVGLTSQTWWLPNTEKWRLRAKRQTTPWVMEPAAVNVISAI
ncbi:MAG: hypothetical protein M3Y91_09035 [Actinomycetota bacterium]|nr:hypothetical protein [Actinomycetota bacterium]